MAVTRINNNQITTASAGNAYLGINAAAKLQNYSITSNKIANSLVYGSDLTVSGNLTVNGTTTTVDTVNTLIKDPILVLADGQTAGTPTVDIGILGYRGNQNSSFLGWQETGQTFMAILSNTTVSNTTVNVSSYANFTASTITAQANLSVIGNIVGNANFSGNLAAGNILTPGLISATGNATAGNILTAGIVSATSNVVGGNILTVGIVSSTGNATAGNILTAGVVSATANITGGNVLTAGLISATSTITSAANITGGNVLTAGVVSATANITGGNVLTAGIVSATGNATAGNVLTAGVVSATANVTGGNVLTAGIVSATANITTAEAFNGATLSLSGNVTSALNVTGNIAGGNILTPGLISATGNATAGNVLTAGLVSATGNVSGGNVIGAALVQGANLSATANVTTVNVLASGFVSAAGNITSATNVNTPNVVAAANLTLSTSGSGNILISPTTGNIVINNTYINGVSQPVQNNDVATKIYVDNAVSTQIAYHQAVYVATTSNLATATGGTITYNNGANGIGANITTTGSFNLIDTANVQTANTRILVKNEGNAALNGVYVWSNATVITRSTDADEYGPNSATQLSINDYFFVTDGNVNKGSAYVVDEPTGVITFGTSNIAFAQFSSSQTYTGGNGISLYGTVISTVYDNSTIGVNGSNQLYIPANAPLTTPNIGAATGTSLSVTGAVTAGTTLSSVGNTIAGNVLTAGLVSATGNITTAGAFNGANLSLSGNVLSALNVTGNITGANLLTPGLVSATGNATAGNVLTAGVVSATANITGGNVLTAGLISATGNATAGNVLTAGIVSATGNATAGNVLTAGQVSATGNLTAGNVVSNGNVIATSAANVTFGDNTWMYTGYTTLNTSGIFHDTGANPDTVQVSTNSRANGIAMWTNGVANSYINSTGGIEFVTGSTLNANSNPTGGVSRVQITTTGLTANGIVSASGNVTGANVNTAGLVSATGNIYGGNLILAGAALDTSAGRLTVNSTSADADFAINGDTVANVFYVDAGVGVAAFGSSTVVANALVSFNTDTSILLPVGNTGVRPSNASSSTGMVRFNTTLNSLEVYDNTEWTTVGGTTFTVIADEQFNGDGSTVAFTLATTQTTNSCIVSINGIVQIPGSAYSVAGTAPTCVLTFTEAPSVSDLIDVREITTTTSVTSVANNSGNAQIAGNATAAQMEVTGNLVMLPGGTIYTYDILNAGANGTGNIGNATNSFNTIFAKATSAQYADLAEKYVADAEYAPGTVVSFGGDKEVTQSAKDADRAVAGVVSTNPSYIMNATLEAEHVAVVAFTGRVPTSVTGTVAKGDLMVSNGDGTARAEQDPRAGSIIGKALENFDGATGVIEVVIGRF